MLNPTQTPVPANVWRAETGRTIPLKENFSSSVIDTAAIPPTEWKARVQAFRASQQKLG